MAFHGAAALFGAKIHGDDGSHTSSKPGGMTGISPSPKHSKSKESKPAGPTLFVPENYI